MEKKFKKGKGVILLIFGLFIIMFGINSVSAQTIMTCPSGKYPVSGTDKCCAKFHGVKSTSISYNNECEYPQSSVSSKYAHKGGTYNGVTCPLIGKYCYGGYPSNMIKTTYTTTIAVLDHNGDVYYNVTCVSAQCQKEISYAKCPSGTYYSGLKKISGSVSVFGKSLYTTSSSVSNYTGTVQVVCTPNKVYYGSTGGAGTVTSPIETTDTETNTCPKSGNTTKITNVNNYKITYNLDGGHFLDGSTSRTEIVKDNSSVGALRLNPLKNGYKFVSWQDESGKDFDFNSKISKDITLKATYEKIEDELKDAYSCPNGYTLDPSSTKCYKMLNFNSTSNASLSGIFYVPNQSTADPISGTAYNYTTYAYADGDRMCYGYNAPNDGDPGSIALMGDKEPSATGKDNATYYFKDGSGYTEYEDQDWWKSEDTCNFGSNCSLDACTKISGSCKVTYSAIIFHVVDATFEKKLDTTEVVQLQDETNDENDDKVLQEIIDNPKTGTILMVIAWVVGFTALGYSIYYFRKNRVNNID